MIEHISVPKQRIFRLRQRKEAWQKAAYGMLALSVAANTALCGALAQSRKHWQAEAANWQSRYHAAVAIEQDAVQAYGSLLQQVEAEKAFRAEQAAAYEAAGAWEYVGECTINAYCPCAACCGRWADGLAASGIPAEPGVVAVDPEVIPPGSTVVIDGLRYLAADTGSGVEGQHIDLCVASHDQAEAFGVQRLDVWVEPCT